jgi:uncharacterized repeat protein (TIGR01451 family)/LPXTG-motif cell wall-anchored protein
MSKLTSLIRRAPKRFSAVVAMVAAAIIIPAAVFAWGPVRETFTIDNPSDHIQFNSITNNPNIGDERNFVGIREAGAANVWSDDVTVQDGKEYYVRMYVHNNAASSLNLVAENVTAKFNLPTTTAKSIQVNGFLSASNVGAEKNGNKGAYAEVYDHATFNSDRNFNLAYVSGSLKYENNAFGAAGTALSESIFTSTGAKLGYDKLDGKIPGCFQYAGYVTFKVKPQIAKTTNFNLTKMVSKHGEGKWVENYKAQPGEKVDFLLSYQNTGEVQHDDVTFRDTLPKGLSYVKDSTTWNNASQKNKQADNNLTTGVGVNVGSYAPKANAWIVFSAKVAEKDQLECGTNTLVNKGKVNTGGYAVEDTATVTVDKECKPVAKYTCDSLKVTTVDRTNFKFAVDYTVQNATFKKVTYVIRNAQGTIVDTKTSTAKTLNYAQTKVGAYTVQATITVSVDGVEKTVTNENCKGSFKVPELPPKDIQVCELATKKIITIKENDFDSSKHSKNLKDCEVVVKNIKVCELSTKKIITINEKDFDSSKHSKNLADCKEVPPVTIEVCDLSTKTIVTINEKDFDETKHTKDLNQCAVTPPELPQTGASENIVAIVGLGALIASFAYYIASRRALNQ